MSQKRNVIEINGLRYDASSGAALEPATGGRQITVQTEEPPKAPVINAKPLAAKLVPHTTEALDSHAPQPSKTLMRQSVSKPTLKPKPFSNAQGHLPAATVKVMVKPSITRLDANRLRHAHKVGRSQLISRFSKNELAAEPDFSVPVKHHPATPEPVAPKTHTPAATAKKHARTTADVLEMAVQHATSHLQPPVKPAKRHRVWQRRHAPAH